MRENFDKSLAFVLLDEGGGAIRAAEPGGAVFHGVSLMAYRYWCKRHGRPEPTVEDLFAISKEDETSLYREDYWEKIHSDDLPAGVDYVMFDAAVMEGVTGANRLMQEALLSSPSDSKALIYELTIGHLVKKLHSPSRLAFGPGWSDRIARVKNRAVEMVA